MAGNRARRMGLTDPARAPEASAAAMRPDRTEKTRSARVLVAATAGSDVTPSPREPVPAAAPANVAASPSADMAAAAGNGATPAVPANASLVPQGTVSSDSMTAGKSMAPVATAGVHPVVTTANMSSAVTHMGMATPTAPVPASVPMMMLCEGA